MTPGGTGPNPRMWQTRTAPDWGGPSRDDAVIGEAHAATCPNCVPTSAQAWSAGTCTVISACTSMPVILRGLRRSAPFPVGEGTHAGSPRWPADRAAPKAQQSLYLANHLLRNILVVLA